MWNWNCVMCNRQWFQVFYLFRRPLWTGADECITTLHTYLHGLYEHPHVNGSLRSKIYANSTYWHRHSGSPHVCKSGVSSIPTLPMDTGVNYGQVHMWAVGIFWDPQGLMYMWAVHQSLVPSILTVPDRHRGPSLHMWVRWIVELEYPLS